MAAAAWASQYSRAKVGAGALLFVASDVLLLAQMGPLAESGLPRLLVWPLYYTGMFLMTNGIIQSAHKRNPQLRVVSSR